MTPTLSAQLEQLKKLAEKHNLHEAAAWLEMMTETSRANSKGPFLAS